MNHYNLILFSLFLLLSFSITEKRFLLWLFIAALGYDLFINEGYNLEHNCLDIIYMAIAAGVVKIMPNFFAKAACIPLAMVFLGYLHTDLDNEGKSYLVQFNTHNDIKEWISDNENNFDVQYPLFRPLDTSTLLDEYILVTAKRYTAHVDHSITQDPRVIYYEDNEQVQLPEMITNTIEKSPNNQAIPNDPQLPNQWISDAFDLKKYHDEIKKANYGQEQKSNTLIAILDTGIDADHEDLLANYTSIKGRYDVDTKGHGTHCAGIAAAVTGNNIGIASWIPANTNNIKVTSIKVLNNFGMGTQKTIINGIIEAADAGADVISLSLGGVSSDSKKKAYTEAVEYANNKGSIVVVAAGNSSKNAIEYSPANTPGVITVTAIDSTMRMSRFANTIEEISMGIAAPGESIMSTFPDDTYASHSGTSMAAPFVSGIIAVMKSIKPELDTKTAYKLIQSSAINRKGVKIINPLKAVKSLYDKQSTHVKIKMIQSELSLN